MKWTPEAISWLAVAFLPLIMSAVLPLLIFPWFCCVAYYFYQQFYSPQFLPTKDKVVYVTGCDSGFGQAVAIELDQRGCHVFAGCLDTQGQGADCLRAQASNRLHILDCDVTDQKKIDICAEEISSFCQKNEIAGLWGVYNNAGIATSGEIEWLSLDDYQRAMDVNLWGSVRVTKSVLPLIRRAGGRVVAVTSGISRSVNPGRSPYTLSKSALEAFMDTLRYEMAKFNVHVSTIQPGNLTGVTNVFAAMSSHLDRVYREMDGAIKADYGQEYLDAFKRRICNKYTAQGSQATGTGALFDDVIQSIFHALFAASPRPRYKPAQLSWIVWWRVHDILPECITDRIVAHWNQLPKPAST